MYDYRNYFDPNWYLQQNKDVAAAGVDPRTHFDTFGWKEGRNPSSYFDTSDYLSSYGDVAAAGVNPLEHYLQFGMTEGRSPFAGPSPLFDPNYYLSQNPDVKAAGVDPISHYQQFGFKEGRDPGTGFDTSSYFTAYPDVAKAGVNPFEHYQTFGIGEGRTPTQAGTPPNTMPPLGPGGGTGGGGGGGGTGGGGGGGGGGGVTPTTKTRSQVAAEGRTSLGDYFRGRGANPDKYSQNIEDRIASVIAGLTDTQLQGSNLFAGEAESLYGGLQNTYRQNALSAFDKAQPANPFTSTFDDAIIESILGEQRTGADKFVNNMLKRGQIDDFGAEKARNELNRQAATGREKLNTLGSGILDPQSGTYAESVGARRKAIENIGLDAPYDVNPPGGRQSAINDFTFSLGNQLRQGAGNLFSTANLPSVAGYTPGSFGASKAPFVARGGGGRTPGGSTTEDEENVLF